MFETLAAGQGGGGRSKFQVGSQIQVLVLVVLVLVLVLVVFDSEPRCGNPSLTTQLDWNNTQFH